MFTMTSPLDKNLSAVSSPDSAFSEGSMNDFDFEDNSQFETLISQIMYNSEDVQNDMMSYFQSETPSSEEIASFDVDNFFKSDLINDDFFSGDPNTSICNSVYHENPNTFENKLKPVFDDIAFSSRNISDATDNQLTLGEINSAFDQAFDQTFDQPLFGNQSELIESNYLNDKDDPVSVFTDNQKQPEPTYLFPNSSLSTAISSSLPSYHTKCRKLNNCFQETENKFCSEPNLGKYTAKYNSVHTNIHGYFNDKQQDNRTSTSMHLLSPTDSSSYGVDNSYNYNETKSSKSFKKKDVFAIPKSPNVISKSSCLQKVLTGHLSCALSQNSFNFPQHQQRNMQSSAFPNKTDSRYFSYVQGLKHKQSDKQVHISNSKKNISSHRSSPKTENVSELEKYLRGIIPMGKDNGGLSYLGDTSSKLNHMKKNKSTFLYKLLTGEISQELYSEIDCKLRETERANLAS
ncbi:uncharacterized protein LOC115230399 [Argonauta hians]